MAVREMMRVASGHGGLILAFRPAVERAVMQEPHVHAQLEFNVVVAGTGAYLVGDRRYDLRRGSLAWLKPEQPHRLVQTSADFTMHVVVLEPWTCREVCRHCPGLGEFLLNQGAECLRHVPPHNLAQLHETCRMLQTGNLSSGTLEFAGVAYGRATNRTYRHENPGMLNAGLQFLTSHAWQVFARHGRSHPVAHLHPAVIRALRLLDGEEGEEELVLELGLGELAAECGVSASRLSRLFKQQVGMGVSAYRNQRRLLRFLRLRRETAKNLLECCLDAGFGSYSQFHKVFREAYGAGPRTLADVIASVSGD